jgi:hypothetical protein
MKNLRIRLVSCLNAPRRCATGLLLALAGGAALSPAAAAPEIISVQRIWDAGGHNAFTDLIRWHEQWWCTFRESAAHVGGDGAIRVLRSVDGEKWESAARLTEKDVDLRDPKLSVMPAGDLMLNCGGSVYEGKTLKGKQSRVLFSPDGRSWTAPQRILSEGEWCWRVTWHAGVAYAAVYRSTGAAPAGEWSLAIYRGTDGVHWDLLKAMEVNGRPNETTLRFDRNGDMIALVRREAGDTMGYVGRAQPPYTDWQWQVSNLRFGGQNFIPLPDGRWIVGTREYAGKQPGAPAGSRTIIAELGRDGQLTRLLTLPSSGDTSYPGLVWQDGVLWVSYYSSHEKKTAIYLAKVKP